MISMRGYQTWWTNQGTVAAVTFTPFVIGWGYRKELPDRLIGICDIVFMGLGISIEWEAKNKETI